jgi:hypothetical protein
MLAMSKKYFIKLQTDCTTANAFTYWADWRENTRITLLKVSIVPLPSKTKMNITGMSLVVTTCECHKISNHHLDHELWWLAAVTPHWLHQLLMLGVDKL